MALLIMVCGGIFARISEFFQRMTVLHELPVPYSNPALRASVPADVPPLAIHLTVAEMGLLALELELIRSKAVTLKRWKRNLLILFTFLFERMFVFIIFSTEIETPAWTGFIQPMSEIW